MAVDVAFFSIPVADYQAAVPWYERLMGRQPDMIPNENEAAWQVSEQAWFYVLGDAQRAGTALLTLIVDDLDDQIAGFKERGIACMPTEEDSEIYRRILVTDLEGNTFQYTQLTNKDNQA